MKRAAAVQYVLNGALVIEPAPEFTEQERHMFACGATVIRPNDVFYPATPVQHFEIETRGPWGTVSKVRGFAIETETEGVHPNTGDTIRVTIHGMRSLLNPRESGYQMEGHVSIGGKKYRAFTSSRLFELPGGELCDVAVLYVCKPACKPEVLPNEMFDMAGGRDGAV